MQPPPAQRTFTGHAVASRVLAQMLQNHFLTDLTVTASGKSFPCHRAVLAAASPVFDAMFRSTMLEQSSGHLQLPDTPPDVFAIVRQYIYGRPLHVPDHLAISVSTFVRRYEVALPDLSDFLDALLTSALTLDNVLAVRQHADHHSAHRLRRNCDRFITTRMNSLPETLSFLESPPPSAEAALRAPSNVSRDALSRKSAQYVLAAAVAWLAHNEPQRAQHLETMLNTVDVNGLSLPALVRASRDRIALKSQPFQARLLRAFAMKAERDLGFGPIGQGGLGAGTGFAIVDQHAPRGDVDLFHGAVPGSLYPGSLYHVRRRSTLAASLVHHRFPSAAGSSLNPSQHGSVGNNENES